MMCEFLVVLFLAAFTVLFVDGVQSNDDVMEAIEEGDKEKLVALLSNGSDINECLESADETPLNFAILKKKEELALHIIEMGADLDASCVGSRYHSSLVPATKLRSIKLIKVLLAKGVKIDEWSAALAIQMADYEIDIFGLFLQNGLDPNIECIVCNRTLLYLSVTFGNVNLTKLLLGNGADIEHKDCDGYTVLNRACRLLGDYRRDNYFHLEETSEILIDGGANVNTIDEEERTPLMFATEFSSVILVKKLIEKGADVNAVDMRGNTPWSIAHLKGFDIVVRLLLKNGAHMLVGESLREIIGNSLSTDDVIEAIKAGDKEKLLNLLANGTDINRCLDGNAFTPLLFAIAMRKEEIALILLEKGRADPNGTCEGYEAPTPLAIAAQEGFTALVKVLLDKGVEIRDNALMKSIYNDRKDIVELFLQTGIDPNEPLGYRNQAMLTRAADSGSENVTKFLIEKGVDLELKDFQGNTPLNWVCINVESNYTVFEKVEKCAVLLIDGGANVNTTNRYGRTPLINVSEHNSSIIVKKLIEKGADVNVVDEMGHTPWSIANAKGFQNIAKILQDHGADINKGKSPRIRHPR